MYFDRFDICEAWYMYLSHYHEGQGSEEYRRLSKLLTHFSPRGSLRSELDLTDNGYAIYCQLEHDHAR